MRRHYYKNEKKHFYKKEYKNMMSIRKISMRFFYVLLLTYMLLEHRNMDHMTKFFLLQAWFLSQT